LLQPLSEMLTTCLHSRLSVICHVINTHLLHVLRRDHCLLDCFTVIRVRPYDVVSLSSLLLIMDYASFTFSCCLIGRAPYL